MIVDKGKFICATLILLYSFTFPTFAGTSNSGPGYTQVINEKLRDSLEGNWLVNGRYALNKEDGNIYFSPDGISFASNTIACDGCAYDSAGIQKNTLSYIRDKYITLYTLSNEEENIAFDSKQEAMLFICWLQLEKAGCQGIPYTITELSDGSVTINKKDLLKIEEAGISQYSLDIAQDIADCIPDSYPLEQKVNAAMAQVALKMKYDKDYETRNMEEALREGKGVCYHYSKLLKSVLTKLGVESEYVVGYQNPQKQTHVWLKIFNGENNRWIYRDPTQAATDLGNGLFTVSIYETYLGIYQMMPVRQDAKKWQV